VEFRIECDDRNTLYLSSVDTQRGVAQTDHQWTNTGTVDVVPQTPTFFHIWGQEFSGGQWMSAEFQAPPGYSWVETDSAYLVTTTDATKQPGRALWSASHEVAWEDAGYQPWDPTTSPNPPSSQGDADTDHYIAGTKRIWSQSPGDNQSVYFSTRGTLEPTVTSIQGTPLASIDTSLTGLNVQAVHPGTMFGGVEGLGEADAALSLRPGDAGHYASSVSTFDRAHFERQGAYADPAGFLLSSERHNNAVGHEVAVRMSGYVYAPSDDYTRSFAVGSNDGFRLEIGETIVWEDSSTRQVPDPPDTVPVSFPTEGYYPIEVTWFQDESESGFELSSRAGVHYAADWTAADFEILGTDPSFPVYQRPDGVAAANEVGPESAGAPLLAGSVDPGLSDGLRVQVVTTGTGWSHIEETEALFRNQDYGGTPDAGAVAQASVLDFAGNSGNYSFDNPFPQDADFNGNNFGMRINGLVYVETPGDYAVAVATDDAYRLRIGDAPAGQHATGRGVPTGWANYNLVHFEQPGLYPVEFYMNQGTGGYAAEIAAGAFPGLIVPDRAPDELGLSPDMSGMVFTVEPVARLEAVNASLQGAAFGRVDALDTEVPVERWTLQRQAVGGGPRVQGLLGQYYDYSSGGGDWDDSMSAVGSRDDLTSGGFDFGNNYGYGPWGDIEDQFAARWTGFLEVPETGVYSFRMNSDDRSWMFIDLDGDGELDPAPGNNNWTVNWNDVELAEGLHAVEFRAREFHGGETSKLEWLAPGMSSWQVIGSEYFSQNLYDGAWVPLMFGFDEQIGTADLNGLLGQFDVNADPIQLRLISSVAGLTVVAEDGFLFVPEPSAVLLLGLGALILCAFRRRAH
jgi:hypothetical protein